MNRKKKKAVLLLSGGIDSTTLLAFLTKNNYEVHCLVFDYGQTLKKEIDVARRNCLKYGQRFLLLKSDLTECAKNCSLVNKSLKIQSGRTLKQINAKTPTSYVPFRNGIFLAYAVAYGETHKIKEIYCGGNGLNSGQYNDDTLEFAKAFDKAAKIGTSNEYTPEIKFPWAGLSKKAVVDIGRHMDIDYRNQTWSCYHNGKEHCGQCDSCKQRTNALTK